LAVAYFIRYVEWKEVAVIASKNYPSICLEGLIRIPGLWLIIESGVSRIRSRSTNHSTLTLGCLVHGAVPAFYTLGTEAVSNHMRPTSMWLTHAAL
jgi:hypothetical protein